MKTDFKRGASLVRLASRTRQGSRHKSLRIALVAVVFQAALGAHAQVQRNGEATSSVPVVERQPYDMRTPMAPLKLSDRELNGRRLLAQRCGNCHAGNPRQPGPLLGKAVVESRGDAFIRDKVRKGSALMPGFEYTLQPAQIDDIIAFLKTYSPPPRSQGAAEE